MPTPYEQMFGVTPAPGPALNPNQPIPGVPAQYQNLPPGQMVPDPTQVMPAWTSPAPLPSFIQQQPQPIVPTGQPLSPVQEQYAPIPGQGMPMPAPGTAQPGQAPAPLPGQAAQVPTPVHHTTPVHADTMVKDFNAQIEQLQKDVQGASAEEQAAILQGAKDVSGAQGELSKERLAAAAELAAKQAEVQAHNKELDAIDTANLQQARDATIPDFWKSREGARVGSSIAVALAGIGAGLLGQTNNQALTAVQHNIDQYFNREKDRIDNLYKYASEQGKINDKTRYQYAQELLNLKDQHSYVMQAAADRVNQVSTMAQGSVNAAAAKVVATKFGKDAIDELKSVRELRSKILLQQSEEAKNYAAAAESRARASQGGYLTPAQVQTTVFRMGRELDTAFKHISGPKGLNETAEELGSNIRLAAEQPNNPAPFVGMMDALVKAYSGGKVTQQQFNTWMAHIAPGVDKPEQVIEAFRTGKASATQRRNLTDLALGRYNTIRGELKEAYDQYENVTSGPEFEQYPAMKQLKERKKKETFGRSPGFGGHEPNLGGAQLSPNVTGQTPGQAGAGPATVQVKMGDGSIAVFDQATGKRIK